MYDYLIVGAGLFGAVFARLMTDAGKRCLVIDRRTHIAGNIYSEEIEGIQVHMYGPHIFHTNNLNIWKFVNRFANFNQFIYSPVANYKGEIYNLPFNMNTFTKMWGVVTPDQAKKVIIEQIEKAGIISPQNLEEQAISLVGMDIYEKLIKGYTQKQWGKPCSELPAYIIKRIPVRYTFDNNYFDHPYQGIPVEGYTNFVENLLYGIEVRLNEDFLKKRNEFSLIANRIVYTGAMDEYFDYCYGELEYRSLRFETEIINSSNYQGVAGMNYTDIDTPFTRIVEHKHFNPYYAESNKTVITREYPAKWEIGDEPFYPLNDKKNSLLYQKYNNKAKLEKNVIFGGRLGLYQYFDMDKVIEKAFEIAKCENSDIKYYINN